MFKMILTVLPAVVVFLLWQSINLGIQMATHPPGDTPLIDLVGHGLGPSFVTVSLLLLAIVAVFRWWRGVGLAQGPQRGTLRIIWPWLLYLLFMAASVATMGLPPLPVTAFILANTMLVGFSEELMFRGILLRGLHQSFGIWPAIIGSTVLFAGIHVLNVFLTGILSAALLQAGSAFLSGLFLVAVRLRTRSLWTGIVLHGLWDFATFLIAAKAGTPVPGPTSQYGSILFGLPLALIALFLLRHAGRDYGKDFE
jgi:uncharacterized protein